MKLKFLLGYDIGSSSIKASLLNADTGKLVISTNSPDQEMKIDSPQPGWAEQHPENWWKHLINATKKIFINLSSDSYEISGIGISYQMHGLVMVNKSHEVIYPSIIWCDSRAVETGNKAFIDLGQEYCLSRYLNSPGNFTASKLKWVKENKPDIYSDIYKMMLPGDFIAMKLTGEIHTTISGLSEGIFWDFNQRNISEDLISYFGLNRNHLPDIVPTFGYQGTITSGAAKELGLNPGIPVTYRAGDQPNNALSLNVLNTGEIAATAGTSGVIYGVANKSIYDNETRVNTFAHVNYSTEKPNVGVLLCINGTGIQYSWIKQNVLDNNFTYEELNELAERVNVGADALLCFPFGNGAERLLNNKNIQAHFSGINFNLHGKGHLIRSAQEGIAFSFRYGMDIMKKIGIEFNIIRAGNSNLFQSKVFREAFVNSCNVNLEIYNTDGAQGAARGAGIGSGLFLSEKDAFNGLNKIETLKPESAKVEKYNSIYQTWGNKLKRLLQ